MTTIVTSNFATAKAHGGGRNANSVPVICLKGKAKGEVYASMTDAAIKNELSVSGISAVICGRTKTCGGMVWRRVDELDENVDIVSAQLLRAAELEEKAAKWDAYEAEQERIRKAEEKRQAEVAKAQAKADKYNAMVERIREQLRLAEEKAEAANAELAEMTGEPLHVVA